MIDLSAPGARLLRPRTLFGRILHFLAAAILWFLVVGTLLVLVQSLGLGKPKASITTPLFLFSLILLWKALVPSGKELRDFREAEQAKDRARREAALQTAAAAGDAKAAIALGNLYRDGLGSQKDLARALHHYEGAAATGSASAQKAVAAAREELAQSEADRRRAALEAEVPAVLDAQCPNCAAPLSASSHKCHSCGAVFFVSADGWQPIPVSVGPASMPASRTQSRGKAEPPALAIQAQVPEKKPPLTVAQRVARLFIWAGHICLIASLWAMVLGQPESGLARLIIVAPLFYLVGVAMKAVLFTAGVLGQKNLTE